MRDQLPGSYKHVHRFTDRHGVERFYLRVPGAKSVPLPAPTDRTFHSVYTRTLAEVKANMTTDGHKSASIWSKQRLFQAIKDTMGDTGVYLLLRKGSIVYVGSSGNCAKRVASHRSAGRPFDRAFYIYAEAGDRQKLEATLIRAIGPVENKVRPRDQI